jgi:hypothetical protein
VNIFKKTCVEKIHWIRLWPRERKKKRRKKEEAGFAAMAGDAHPGHPSLAVGLA